MLEIGAAASEGNRLGRPLTALRPRLPLAPAVLSSPTATDAPPRARRRRRTSRTACGSSTTSAPAPRSRPTSEPPRPHPTAATFSAHSPPDNAVRAGTPGTRSAGFGVLRASDLRAQGASRGGSCKCRGPAALADRSAAQPVGGVGVGGSNRAGGGSCVGADRWTRGGWGGGEWSCCGSM